MTEGSLKYATKDNCWNMTVKMFKSLIISHFLKFYYTSINTEDSSILLFLNISFNFPNERGQKWTKMSNTFLYVSCQLTWACDDILNKKILIDAWEVICKMWCYMSKLTFPIAFYLQNWIFFFSKNKRLKMK